MREYEIRMREHEKRLPRVREKLAAALALFIVGSLMLTVVTFSWLTLSTSPEVSNTALLITSNGNLEIALAKDILLDGNGNPIYDDNGNVIPVAPGASQVGDSGKDLFDRNTTWGNLVNLSDEIYGLENIVLRPATLNTNALLSQPLFAAKYDTDGRITELRSDFAYTQWNGTLNEFQASSNKGVKAISSVKFDNVEYENPLLGSYDKKVANIKLTLEMARVEFNALSSSPNMSAINGIMSTYMNGTLRQDVDSEACSVEDIQKFYDMMVEVYNGPMKTIGEAYMEIIELYQLDTYGQNNSTDLNYQRFENLDVFCAEIKGYIAQMNVDRANFTDGNGNPTPKAAIDIANDIPNLEQYLEDRAALLTYIGQLEAYKGSVGTTWGDIKHIVNFVVDIDSCEINGKTVTTLTGNLSAYGSELLGMIGEGKANQNNAVVKKGLMQRLDLMLHNGVEGFKISKATITIDKAALKARVQNSSMSSLAGMVDLVIRDDTGVAEANIKTNAKSISEVGTLKTDVDKAFKKVGAQNVIKTFVAKDTYGLSIDFWVRTNADNSFLVLEGTVIYDYIDITKDVVLYNDEGEPITHSGVQIYIADVTVTTETDGVVETRTDKDCEVFEIDGAWYLYLGTEKLNQTVTDVTDDGQQQTITKTIVSTPEKKQDKIPVGYTGANRIWTEEELEGMSESDFRTTQGAGTCYTYYADPSEKAQINQVLSALKVVFVSADGRVLGSARLATELCISEYGKHTIPIVLDESCLDTGIVNGDGEAIRAITELEKNEATFVTAIIYLDGKEVTNDSVLSFANIEGKFNFQFGNTQGLDPVENEELMGEEIVVSGNVASETGVINPSIDYFEGLSEQGYKTIVTLTIDGEAPSTVHAYFLRKISETQGTKQEKITFTRKAGSANQWVAEAVFYSPGTYILRSVVVDGIERDLNISKGGSPPMVTIDGFSCTNFHGINGQTHIYRTAENSVAEKFYVNVSSTDDGLLPKSIEAIFMDDSGKSVTVTFTDSDRDTLYEGLATFKSSGIYTCRYLVVDGEYYELPMEYTREVYTGLKVSVWLSQAEDDVFDQTEEMIFSEKGYQYIHTGFSHKFNVQLRIYDNAGNPIEGLTNVSLYYSRDTDANLRWDATTKYYVGQLPTISTPGSYTFERVEVGFETISAAQSAMYIRAIPSDPVSYLGLDGAIAEQIINVAGYQGEEQPQPIVALRFKNADSAMVFGKFSKTTENGTEYIIIAATAVGTGDGSTYKFTLPNEDGIWKLEEVKMSMVYDGETETFYMGDESIEGLFDGSAGEVDPLTVWDEAQDYYVIASKSEWKSTLMVINVDNVILSTNYSGHTFMNPYQLTDRVSVSHVFDGVNEASVSISNVKLTYQHTKTDANVSWSGDDAVAKIEKTLSATGNSFNMPEGSTLHLPGTYIVTLNYTLNVNGQEYSVSRTIGQANLSYSLPTVKIVKTSPSGNVSAYNGVKTSWGSVTSITTVDYTAGITNNNTVANVCYIGTRSATNILIGTYYTCNLTQPSVTINLSNIGNATSATLSFPEGSHIYASNSGSDTTKSQYQWTKDGDCIRYIGQWKSVTGNDSRTVAGTITATTLTVNCGDLGTFIVDIADITINNPY